ncbi:asparagine synthase-related protein [Streptomyces sp. NPDC053048]|uniref:asparagine synthase-related protein n=1 Tax=Streptomyces sp. NPDC053048 TaxID=3365694 RepID=UPI0037CD1739
MAESGTCWFVVLPDREPAPAVAEKLRRYACRRLPHASGRPWLVGCWEPGQVTVAARGTTRVALAGTCSLGESTLAGRLRSVRAASDVESVVVDAAGSFHVVASVAGRVYARGTLSGARRLYRAEIDGVTVAADRARTLAWLTGAEPDVRQLASRLVLPALPHPLAGGGMWRGVRAVPGGEALHLDGDGGSRLDGGGGSHLDGHGGPHRDGNGGSRTTRWWTAPPGELPLAVGAPGVRRALLEAVEARVRPGHVLGADLSGGLDSTSLCFLAARAGADLVTATIHWAAPGSEDAAFADRAAAQLPGAERLVFGPGDLPVCLTGIGERREPGDEPSVALRDRAQQRHIADAMRAAGAVRRLSGLGGDHVVQAPVQYVHPLVRHHPAVGLRHVAGYRARGRWPLRTTARALIDARSYAAWLAATAMALHQDAGPGAAPIGWGPRPALPAWASHQAAEIAAALLREAARDATPLAGDRGRHAWIDQAQAAGRTAAQLSFEAAAAGLPADSPYCDDAVVSACLAVRLQDTRTPWSYKPLLSEAMRGLVPDRILARTSKDGSTVEWYAGLRHHQAELAAWAADSHLVAAGLADERGLRHALLSPGLLDRSGPALEATLAVEEWLRDVAAHPVPAYLREHTDEHATAH